jgi:tetratricopeptide (TPR) repeat protein
MGDLAPPDSHHLSAVLGWLELGNQREARAEWERITPDHRHHPEVLEAEWRLCAEEKGWPAALAAAQRLVGLDPENPSGWIHQSYSLHELKRTAEAWNQLATVAEKFASLSPVAYNLACYASQLGHLEAARRWLDRAIQLQGRDAIKAMALADPDLAPMRNEIERL